MHRFFFFLFSSMICASFSCLQAAEASAESKPPERESPDAKARRFGSAAPRPLLRKRSEESPTAGDAKRTTPSVRINLDPVSEDGPGSPARPSARRRPETPRPEPYSFVVPGVIRIGEAAPPRDGEPASETEKGGETHDAE